MSVLITTSPIGMANLSPAAPGRLLPVALTQIFNQLGGQNLRTAVLWNAGIKPNVTDPAKQCAEALAAYGMQNDLLPQYADSDPAYHKWAIEQIKLALQKGTITRGIESVLSCGDCKGPQVLAAAKAPSTCANCGSGYTTMSESRDVMCMPLAHHADELATHIEIINRPGNWTGQLASMPESALISKARKTGIPLDEIGMPGLKLDPRVSNALLPLYAAHQKKHDAVWCIVGLDTLNKVAPFGHGFRKNELSKMGYIGISKMPAKEMLADVSVASEIGIHETFAILSVLSLDGKKWIDYPARQKELLTFARRQAKRRLKSEDMLNGARMALQGNQTSSMSDIVQNLISSIKSKGPNCSA